jgi:hypothetical protein
MRRIKIRPDTFEALRRVSRFGEIQSDYKKTGTIELDEELIIKLKTLMSPGQSYDDAIHALVDEYEGKSQSTH